MLRHYANRETDPIQGRDTGAERHSRNICSGVGARLIRWWLGRFVCDVRACATSLAGATDQLIAHLQDSNPNLRVVSNNERRRVDGQQAMVVQMTNESPIGGDETDWLVAVMRPIGMLRYFVGVAPQAEFGRYQRTFDQIVMSAQFLD